MRVKWFGVHVCEVIWCLCDICMACEVEEAVFVCLLKIAWCELSGSPICIQGQQEVISKADRKQLAVHLILIIMFNF